MVRILTASVLICSLVALAACLGDADAASERAYGSDAAAAVSSDPHASPAADRYASSTHAAPAADRYTSTTSDAAAADPSIHPTDQHQPGARQDREGGAHRQGINTPTHQNTNTSTRQTPSFRVFGYHAWWMRDLWKTYDLDLLDKVMYFELSVGMDGRIAEPNGWPGTSSGLADALRERNVPVVPTVAVLNPGIFRSIFGSRATMDVLHDEVMSAVREAGADGVHLNIEIFEPVATELRDNLTSFVSRLRGSLTSYKSGAELSVFTPGFDHAEAYDEAALATASDYLVVQGYDMHWVNGPEAGPLAPTAGWNGVNWEGIVDRYVAAGVPAHKIVITVPYYGYEWPTVSEHPGAATRGDAQTITYAPVDADYLPLIRINALERTARYGARRDPATQTPYYVYQGEDGWYQGWYEDEVSLEEKYRFVRERNLAGIAIFLLGYDGGKLMSSLY